MVTPVPQHLFEVTSGLRSLVLGEAEIAGQLKTSFETARREGRTTSMLHDLFQHAFRCAKRVATQAPVGARSEEHTSELQSRGHLVCRLLLEKKKQQKHCNNKAK